MPRARSPNARVLQDHSIVRPMGTLSLSRALNINSQKFSQPLSAMPHRLDRSLLWLSRVLARTRDRNDDVMHLRSFREAARLPCQTFNPGPQRQMFALNLLGIAFAWAVHLSVQMPRVRAPMIRMKTGEPEGLQQRFQLQKDLIFASSEHIRQDLAG